MRVRKDIIPPGMEIIFERFRYAPGVLVDDTLYIAGQVGRDENLQVVSGTEAQFTQAFENVGKVLRAAGASFDDVVEMVTYHLDMRDLVFVHGGQESLLHWPCTGLDRHWRDRARDAGPSSLSDLG